MGFDIHPLRTAVINSITAGVAFGLVRNRLSHPPLEPVAWPTGRKAPRVQIIVPARNEERNIARLLDSLVVQSYPPGRWGIAVVDDHSDDSTAAIVQRYCEDCPRVRLVRARDLPPGWTGKSNSMYSGFGAAGPKTDYLLYVDADTEYHAGMLSSIVAAAQERSASLLSLVLDADLRTFWQRLLLPQAGELYALLAGTMDAVNRETGPAAANGQCMLVDYDAFARYGALHEVAGDVAEDRALAAVMKRCGETVRLEHGERLGSVRPYGTFREAWAGYTKTLYWAAGRSTVRTLAVVVALEMYAHLPLLDLVRGLASSDPTRTKRTLRHSALRLLPMLALRVCVCQQTRVPLYFAPLYPLAVAAGNAMLLASWLKSRSRRGVTWKGRAYA